MPRWFTEGLSELETMRARPEWRRRADRDLWGAVQRGELPTLSTLSNAFVRARNSEEATRAYAESAAALDYLDRRFGFPGIRQALIAFGRGERGLAVVARATGVSVADLEAGFRADLAERTARFDSQYLPGETLRLADGRASLSTGTSPPGLEKADFEARRGLTSLRAGDVQGAGQALENARDVPGGTDRRAVIFLTGELALARRKADDALAAFSRLLATPAGNGESPPSADGYDVRVRLALAEIHRHDFASAEGHLKRAMAFDPDSAEATGLMVELLGDPAWKGSRDEDRLAAIAATLRLEPLHGKLAQQLVFGLARRGRLSQVVEAAPLALFIDPAASGVHAAYGRALAATGRQAAAAASLEHALAFGPTRDEEVELRRLLATTYLKLGRPAPTVRTPSPR